MRKFILLLHNDLEAGKNYAPNEMQQLIQAHMDWVQKLIAEGSFLAGDGLVPDGKCMIGKDSLIKDGPYIESKEIIGGYYLLQAKDMDEVLEIAKGCPCHHWGGTTEIRPIMDYGNEK